MFASATRSFATTLVLALSLCSLAAADGPHDDPARRHHAVSRMAAADASSLAKRYDNAKFTYYETGLGACGTTNKDSDWVRTVLA